MSSGWPIGAGKCGSLIASKCGQWGKGGAPLIITPSFNFTERVDYPWNTPYLGNPPALAGSYVGVYLPYGILFYRDRCFALFTIPSGIVISTASFAMNFGIYGSGFNIKVFINSLCHQPVVGNDWNTVANGGEIDSGTLLGTYAPSTTSISIIPASIIPGTVFAVGLATDNDLSNIVPPGSGARSQMINPSTLKLKLNF